mmetsp:Transcript_1841/g.8088  ORF Transcript_1841/g.8088 Transcript_1841/m.8088 type:complete len:239 (-) Transcript_1841:229-945(-)
MRRGPLLFSAAFCASCRRIASWYSCSAKSSRDIVGRLWKGRKTSPLMTCRLSVMLPSTLRSRWVTWMPLRSSGGTTGGARESCAACSPESACRFAAKARMDSSSCRLTSCSTESRTACESAVSHLSRRMSSAASNSLSWPSACSRRISDAASLLRSIAAIFWRSCASSSLIVCSAACCLLNLSIFRRRFAFASSGRTASSPSPSSSCHCCNSAFCTISRSIALIRNAPYAVFAALTAV